MNDNYILLQERFCKNIININYSKELQTTVEIVFEYLIRGMYDETIEKINWSYI